MKQWQVERGNKIANSFLAILYTIIQGRTKITSNTFWTDACVPQNRNRIMSTALFEFLNLGKHIMKEIHHKYQEPDKGCVLEVDKIHCVLGKSLKNVELHRPLTIIKSIVHCDEKKPYKTIQLKVDKFKDFKSQQWQV